MICFTSNLSISNHHIFEVTDTHAYNCISHPITLNQSKSTADRNSKPTADNSAHCISLIITHPYAYNSISIIITYPYAYDRNSKSTTDRNSKPAADSSTQREPYHIISIIITHPYAYDGISLITAFGQPKPAADSSSDGKL